MVRAGLMEKIMSKSNDSSKLDRAPRVRELRDDELENVSGGAVINEDPDALALLSFKDGVRTARE
jgi:hypothetical protein